MAFDFLGTFKEEQLLELENYLNGKITPENNSNTINIVSHVIGEINRLKILKNNFETALKYLGGTQNTNKVLITKRVIKVEELENFIEDKLIEKKIFDEVAMKQRSDIPKVFNDQQKAGLTSKLKKPFLEEIKFQRESLEHKIRKLGDRIEQLEEIRALKLLAIKETTKTLHDLRSLAAIKIPQSAEVKT